MAGGNPSKLVPCTPENARERQLKSAEKRKENNAKKKLMSEIYGDFLAEEFEIKKDGISKKVKGQDLIKEVAKRVLARGDSSSVAMMKEIREGTEGSKINLSGTVKAEMETTEDRIKLFDELVGGK